MVSVCITTYNGEKYIREQLESILTQLGSDDEIIISDDGSVDETIPIIESFNDTRIKIFYHNKLQKNKKSIFKFDLTSRNMEYALNNSSGEFIFMADQDDIWKPNRIKSMVMLLKSYSLVINDCKVIDEDKNIIHDSYFEIVNSRQGFVKNIIKNSYLGCCMGFRKEILEYVMPFPKRAIPHDIWIGLISEIYGEVFFCKEKLVLYRRHGNNLSNSSQKSNNSFLFRIRYRMILLISIFIRIVEFNFMKKQIK